jgi:hypothetical protein
MFHRLILVLAFFIAVPGGALADVIEARHVELMQNEDALTVSADFGFDLSPRLEEALTHGVALYFVVEFELMRPRWYWFDEKAASEKLVLRLFYHTLSRQYRVSRGALYQNFASLGEALRTLGTVRDWVVADREHLKPEESYVASLRMRLDTSQLPKPFQVSALTNREWTLASDWVRIPFTAGHAGSAARGPTPSSPAPRSAASGCSCSPRRAPTRRCSPSTIRCCW